MAGLWDQWNSPDGPLETFTILTTSPNQLVGSIHDRMPVLLSPDQSEHWLNSADASLLVPALLSSLLLARLIRLLDCLLRMERNRVLTL